MSSIGPVVSEEKMFENVDGRRTPDAGVTGILLAHQWAFGSGELIDKLHFLHDEMIFMHCSLQIKQNIYSMGIFRAPVVTQFIVKV